MKIEEQVCSIEQMKELEQLGFDTNKASMAWLGFDNKDWMVAIHNDDCYELSAQTCIPTFSVADMLKMLPKQIDENGYGCFLSISYDISVWIILYKWTSSNGAICENYNVCSKSLRDALFIELKLLKKNKMI